MPRGTSTPVSSRHDGYDHGDLAEESFAQLVYASVDSFHHEDDQYWFSVKAEMSNGANRNLLRLYEDFYNFHIALLEEFPVESGRVGDQPRILPFMPMPLQVVNDSVSASRKVDLNEYVQDLCRLPKRILHHPLVDQLFAVRDGDSETGAGSNNGNGHSNSNSNGNLPGSAMMGRTTPSSPLFHSSAISDRRPSHSAGPRAMYASKSLQQGSSSSGLRNYGEDVGAGGASPSLRSQSAFQSSAINVPGSEEMIKVKISYQDDIMAMRIPVSITFRSLEQKVFERLNTDHKELSYRDDRGDFASLQNDGDVRVAIDRSGGKLMIYVD